MPSVHTQTTQNKVRSVRRVQIENTWEDVLLYAEGGGGSWFREFMPALWHESFWRKKIGSATSAQLINRRQEVAHRRQVLTLHSSQPPIPSTYTGTPAPQPQNQSLSQASPTTHHNSSARHQGPIHVRVRLVGSLSSKPPREESFM